jgi:hypothetical protein
MRAVLTSLVFVAIGYAANAQLSITPKAGLESSLTTINYNNLKDLSPLCSNLNPQIGLRLDYKFKKTHGPYVGLATSRSTVAFRFDDPEAAATTYTATAGDRQIRIETGYQYSFKAIPLGKSSESKQESAAPAAPSASKQGCGKSASRSHCGKSYASESRPGCGSKSKTSVAKNKAPKVWSLRIQPSAGVAFNTGVNPDIETGVNGSTYQYNAGNWKTAAQAGVDFEFGRGRDRMFVVGVQYLKGLDNMNTQSITTQAGTKSTTTYLSSNASSWNVTVGIPFTLSRKHTPKHKEVYKTKEVKKQCIRYSPCRKA